MPPKRAPLEQVPGAGNRSKAAKTSGGKATTASTAKKPAAEDAGKSRKAGTGKAKGDEADASADAAADTIPRSKRWAKVSGSANIDMHYKTIIKDPATAYEWLCTCPASFITGNPIDDEDEDEDEENKGIQNNSGKDKATGAGTGGYDGEKPKCGTKSCVCMKPASEHPGYPWILTKAGLYKYRMQTAHADLRNPDNFDMYTYNDHAGYGVMEVVRNLFLDFAEAVKENRVMEQWAIVEGTALFMLCGAADPMAMVDDGEGVTKMACDIGRMALTALTALDRAGLLAEDSEVKNIGFIMALYLNVASRLKEMSVLDQEDDDDDDEDEDDDDDDDDGAGGRRAVKSNKSTFDATRFDEYIFTFAKKKGIILKGITDMHGLTADLRNSMSMPRANAKDPWAWARVASANRGMGGDRLDITTWSSAQRKAANFDNKDPLGKKERDAIKEGMVLMQG